MQLIRRFYGMLLVFFPRAYREEYSDELQAVFNSSLDDAAQQGNMEITSMVIRELISLPGAIISEHLRQSRKAPKVKKFGAYLHFTYGSRREFFASLYPFILLGAFLPVINMLGQSGIVPVPNPWFDGIGIVLLCVLGLLFLSGIVSGLPRWSLPYAGFLFSLLSAYGLGVWLNNKHMIPFTALYNHSWFLGQVAYQGSLWVGLTVASLLLAALFNFISIFQRFKKDWTLLAFLLYGATPFALVATFDDYVHEEPYELLAFLILILGMWLYLHTDDLQRRFWALFGATTVSLFLAAVTKAIIFSSSSWPYPRLDFSWQNELMSTVIMWMWIALSMLVPFALNLLTPDDQVSTASQI